MRGTSKSRYYAVKVTAIEKITRGDSIDSVLSYIEKYISFPEQKLMIFAVAASVGFGREGSRGVLLSKFNLNTKNIQSLIYQCKLANELNMERFNLFIDLCPCAIRTDKIINIKDLIRFISRCEPSDYKQEEIEQYATLAFKKLKEALRTHPCSVIFRCSLCGEDKPLTKIRFGENRCYDCVESYKAIRQDTEKYKPCIEKRRRIREKTIEMEKKVAEAVVGLKGETKSSIQNISQTELDSIFISFQTRLFEVLNTGQEEINISEVLARLSNIIEEIKETY